MHNWHSSGVRHWPVLLFFESSQLDIVVVAAVWGLLWCFCSLVQMDFMESACDSCTVVFISKQRDPIRIAADIFNRASADGTLNAKGGRCSALNSLSAEWNDYAERVRFLSWAVRL